MKSVSLDARTILMTIVSHNLGISLDFHSYEIGPDGIVGNPLAINRMALTQLRDEFAACISDISANPAVNDKDKAVIDIMLAHWMVMVMKLAWALRSCNAAIHQGDQIFPSQRYPFTIAIVDGELPPDEPLIGGITQGPGRVALWRWPLRIARELLDRPTIPTRPYALVNRESDVVATSSGSLIESHAAKSPDRVFFVDLQHWFDKVDWNETERVSDVHRACAEAAVKKVDPPEKLAKWLRRQIEVTSCLMSVHLERLTRRSDIPKKLWNGTGSGVWHRALATECLRRGYQVVAHDHGTGGGRFRGSLEYFVKGCCSELVTNAEKNKQWLEKYLPIHGLKASSVPMITCLDSTLEYDAGACITQKTQTLGNGRDVLFVPLPLVGEMVHIAPYPDDLMSLDLTARLVGFLTGKGWRVVLKPHPEFPFPSKEYWHSIHGVRIENQRFEKVFQQYDVVLFGYQNTSTVGAAEKAGYPAMILSHENSPWWPEPRSYYDKKFEVIDVSVGADARLNVDLDRVDVGLARLAANNSDRRNTKHV